MYKAVPTVQTLTSPDEWGVSLAASPNVLILLTAPVTNPDGSKETRSLSTWMDRERWATLATFATAQATNA